MIEPFCLARNCFLSVHYLSHSYRRYCLILSMEMLNVALASR